MRFYLCLSGMFYANDTNWFLDYSFLKMASSSTHVTFILFNCFTLMCITSYMYLPFLPVKTVNVLQENTSFEVTNTSYSRASEKHDPGFKLAFFFGLIFGSLAAGFIANMGDLGLASKLSMLLNISVGLIVTRMSPVPSAWDEFLWFFISSAMIAHYLIGNFVNFLQ